MLLATHVLLWNHQMQNQIPYLYLMMLCVWKQDIIRSYFCTGSHKNVDAFYLAHTYSRVPKQLVRDNANFVVMFKQDEMNARHVYSDHVSPDLTFTQFQEMGF